MSVFYFSSFQADMVQYLQECLGPTILVSPHRTGLGFSVRALTDPAAVFTKLAHEPLW